MRSMFVGRYAAVLLFAALMIAVVPGCGGKKVADGAKATLGLLAQSAQESAAAYSAVKSQFTPAAGAPVDEAAFRGWVNDYGDALSAQAIGLSDLVTAVNAGSNLSGATRRQLREAVTTAQARLENFTRARPYVAGPPAATAFLDAHAATIAAQIEAYKKLAELLPEEQQE